MKYSTAILKTPKGKFMLVGSVPSVLSDRRWETEQEAINDLLAIGITYFQKADCSWYDKKQETIWTGCKTASMAG